MPRLLALLCLATPLGGCFPLFWWSSDDSDDPDDDDAWSWGNDDDDDDDEEVLEWDETWIARNLFDGQTAVPRDIEIELAIGYRDWSGSLDGDASPGEEARAREGFESIRLYPEAEPYDLVPIEYSIGERYSSLLLPLLEEDTRYVLDTVGLVQEIVVERPRLGPIVFSTSTAPQVTGIWRSEGTMILAFSEPMDGTTLDLGPGSVDVWWDAGDDLESIASDLNLADFAWETREDLFLVAPIQISGPILVVVAGEVLAATGSPLDGDRDGIPGEIEDDFFDVVEFADLPECFTREDVPAPCARFEDVELDWW